MSKAFPTYTLRLRHRLLTIDRPQVMGIINVTPDSFYAESRTVLPRDIAARAAEMIRQGVDMIDLGAYSSRPGADDVCTSEELARLELAMKAIRSVDTDIPVSIDTFRSEVARNAILNMGADIVNDISGGTLDPKMFETVAELGVPYILMHMRGTPATMQQLTDYDNIAIDVIADLAEKLKHLRLLGVADVIVDPGFGFSKTPSQSLTLMGYISMMRKELGAPVLVGVSRKSMIYRTLDSSPQEALNGTTVLNTLALAQGASILRVHDVHAAVEAVRLSQLCPNPIR